MPIEFVSGDLFDNAHDAQAFALGCNCQGAMAAGRAKTFRARYPERDEEDRRRCKVMTVVRRSSATIAEVVADVGRTGNVLTRHNLPCGVAVFFLFDGDSIFPRTRQWRVIAPDEPTLRSAVSELLGALTRAGIGFNEPRYAGSSCHFRDRGPWATID